MMKTKTKMMGFLFTLIMALSAPLVYADSGNGGGDKDSWHQDGGWHHGQHDHFFAKILNLSDDQVKQLKDSHEKQKATMKALFEQIKSNREAFNAEIVKATPDMNKVTDLQTQFKALQSQKVDNHLSSILEIKKILTPEQFAGYMALKKERKLMGKMMGHGKKDGNAQKCDVHNHWRDNGDN